MPRWYFGHFLLAASQMKAGREDAARAAISYCLTVLPDLSIGYLDRIPLNDEARMSQLRDCLRRTGLPE